MQASNKRGFVKCVLLSVFAFSASLAGTTTSQAQNALLDQALVPALIFNECLEETGGPVNSKRFTDCLTRKVIGDQSTSPTGDPTHRPSTATVREQFREVDQRDLLTCESVDGRKRLCKLHPTRRHHVALVRQISGSPCRAGATWGVEAKGVWVDRGCRALFYVGRQPSNSPSYERWSDHAGDTGLVQPLPDRAPDAVDGWKRCALEYQVCKVPYPTLVRFGAGNKFNQRQVNSEIACTVRQFDNPNPNRQKACYYLPKREDTTSIPAPNRARVASGPVRQARLACERQAFNVLSATQGIKTQRQVALGVGSFTQSELNKEPVLKLRDGRLSGRGLYQKGANWTPFTFTCLLGADGQTAFNFDYQDKRKQSVPAQSLPFIGQFSSEPAALRSNDGRMEWRVEENNNRAWLVHGVAETDTRDFMAICKKGSGKARIIFDAAPVGLQAKEKALITVATKTRAEDYSAAGNKGNNEAGQPLPRLVLKTSDPLWQQLIRDNVFSVNVAGAHAYNVSLRGSSAKVRQFLRVCGS
ncbi:DUF3011 domain-containing protein [Pseudovibrio exalbescens]|uniref:DUF3011 domain-containing protein n=1 Tax=Pseudovibrio exalbescens TaxID=197461 RepID=UPI0023651349|nr:DUF3011 domain-containing protein [Pseudovibrio exalbescens]MDD7910415.1 DUF3011 domain-containing protein [Pseudovibrio exalbescens]